MNVEKAMARAIRDHSMIHEGDRILIGASGGKDSLALSWLLAKMAARMSAQMAGRMADRMPGKVGARMPTRTAASSKPAFELGALKVVIGPDVAEGLHEQSSDNLAQLYASMGIPLRYFGIRANLDPAAMQTDTPPLESVSSCYRCSSLRREALASYARVEGYGTIALGHHLDDILTTALMNLVTHGSGPVMNPCRSYDKLGLRLIRPLAYVPEESIRRLAASQGWDSITCTCPAGTVGDRAEFRRRLEVLCGGSLSAKLKLLKGLGIAL